MERSVHRSICFLVYDAPPSIIERFDERFPLGYGERRQVSDLLRTDGAPAASDEPLSSDRLMRRMVRSMLDDAASGRSHEEAWLIRNRPRTALMRSLKTPPQRRGIEAHGQRLSSVALRMAVTACDVMNLPIGHADRARIVFELFFNTSLVAGIRRIALVKGAVADADVQSLRTSILEVIRMVKLSLNANHARETW